MAGARKKLGLALGIASVFMFGGTLPATRLAVGSIDPLFLTAARWTIAGGTGLALLLVTRCAPPPRALWGELAVTAFCTIVAFPVLMALAMANVPAAHGGVVLGIMPLATVAASTMVTDERPSLGFWLASLAGAGIVLVFVLSNSEARTIGIGDLYLLGTVVVGGFGYALSGRLSMRMPGWQVISWQVAGFLPIAVMTTAWLWPHGLADVPWTGWAGLAYVSLVSQFSAFFALNAAMVLSGVARIGQLMLLQPFVIVALAAPVNGEAIELTTIAYATAVVATVIVSQRMRIKRR